jgi:Flp pilus assembly protein TadD
VEVTWPPSQALLEARIDPFVAYLEKAAHASRRNKPAVRQLWLEAAAELFPLDDDSLEALTRQAADSGQATKAVLMAERLCEIYPKRARAYFRLGLALHYAGEGPRAADPLRRALALDPDLPHARNNLAASLMAANEPPEEIIALLEAALTIKPDDPEPWINLATQYLRVFDLPSAVKAGQRAVELSPDNALACNNYAQALKEAQRFDEAEHFAERALILSGGQPVFRLNLGLLHLLRGKYLSGWDGFEHRAMATPEKAKARPVLGGQPWQGQSLTGKTLLIWGEEGNGDVLQFSRFIPRMAALVRDQGGRLVWNSFPQFGDLLNRSFAQTVDAYVTGGVDRLPPFDYELSLLSTPRLLGVTETAIPAAISYLAADPGLSARWRQRLAGDTRLKVGLVWTGSAAQGRNPYRSVDLAAYAAHLGGLDQVSFYNLQVGAGAEVEAARSAGFLIHDLTADIQTYDDTAALIDNLDLVITICTSVAHLAGALGKPTWVILDVNPHWVWRLERRENLWYPTVRLYRQKTFHDWEPVLSEVASDLRALAAERAMVQNVAP